MIQIPAAMVEAAARALAEHRAEVMGKAGPVSAWDEPPVPPSMHEPWRDTQRRAVTAVLAAALGVCEVREEDGMLQVNTERPELGGELWDGNHYRGWVRDVVAKEWDEIPPDELAPWSWQLVRRFVIVTPAEQVEES